MIAPARWRLAIGEPQWKVPSDPQLAAAPPPDVRVPIETLLQPVPEGVPSIIGVGGITDPTGCQANYFIDPPAGGFAANDIIAQIPQLDFQTVNATYVPEPLGFPPGVYDVIVNYVAGAGLTNAQGYGLRMVPRTAVALTFAGISGARQPFDFPMRGAGISQIRQPTWWRLAIYSYWKFLVYARTVVVDASTLELAVTVTCRHQFGVAAPG